MAGSVAAAPPDSVSVALPVRNGGPLLGEVLDAVGRQRVAVPVEVLVCDSGSSDGSRELAAARGARVIEIPPASFSHGGTRNLLMREARGSHVAFLTQDATPADDLWLARLLDGFTLAPDVALVCGSYRPRPDASVSVARELSQFFAELAPSGEPVLDRASPDPAWRDVASRATFFTDANGAVARWAWERVPYREVAYAEDRMLALDMLAAGHAKAYVPQAAVRHSHEYGAWELFGRWFDEFRGLRETFGHVESARPRRAARRIVDGVRGDRAWAAVHGTGQAGRFGATLRSARYHGTRAVAAPLGSRSDRLPPRLRRALSLEGRDTFIPARA